MFGGEGLGLGVRGENEVGRPEQRERVFLQPENLRTVSGLAPLCFLVSEVPLYSLWCLLEVAFMVNGACASSKIICKKRSRGGSDFDFGLRIPG